MVYKESLDTDDTMAVCTIRMIPLESTKKSENEVNNDIIFDKQNIIRFVVTDALIQLKTVCLAPDFFLPFLTMVGRRAIQVML
jgi:hypothetical protein